MSHSDTNTSHTDTNINKIDWVSSFDENNNYIINLDTYQPIDRLAGSNYSKIGEIFSLKR